MKNTDLGVKPLINTITIIAAVLIIGISFVAYSYNSLVNEAKNYIDEIANLSSSNISQRISVNMRTMESFAAYLGDREMADDKQVISMLMDEISLSGGSVVRYSYADVTGEGYTVRSNGVVNRISVGDTSYFKRAVRGSVFITSTVADGVTGEPVNIYSMPVFSGNSIVGAHMGVANASELEKSLLVDYMEGSGFSYIINSDGERVIDGTFSDAEDYAPFADIGMDSKSVREVRQAIDSNSGGSSLSVRNNDGRNFWVTYRPIGINDWYLMLAVPYGYVIQNAIVLLLISLLVFIVALIGTLSFSWYLNYLKRENSIALYRIAYLDALSGLYNRDGFVLRTTELLDNTNLRYAVVNVDLENFKAINELFGYDTGTELLKAMGKIIGNSVLENEVAARESGDRFIMLIHYRSDDEIKLRLDKLLKEISDCGFNEINNTTYNIIPNIGIYKIPRIPKAEDLEGYIDRAEMAVSVLRENRQGGFAFYDNEIKERLHFEAELENDMLSALADGDFKVYIQPKYSTADEKLAGGEALIRWQHKTKGFLTPDKFVPLFEKNGSITKLDMYVYEAVCRMQAQLISEGYKPVPVSVNQSRLHLYSSGYMEKLKEVLDKYKLPADYVELEITENIALSSGEILEEAVAGWHSLGFKVSMDDFGSGESSLNLLKDIDIDVLKLDKMFFSEKHSGEKSKIIIKSIIDMAKKLNISTVAEGVDNERQLAFLREAGCDLIQGYLFGKPMPYEDFEILFKNSAQKK